MNPGSRKDHDTFCRNEHWLLVRDSRGRSVRHHVTYELALGNGSVLRTRISRPVDKTRYGHALWSVILNKQLCVSEDEFWACVRHRALPGRSRQTEYDDEQMLPAWLVSQLLNTVGVPEADIRNMTVEQATQRLNSFWSAKAPTENFD